MGTPDSHLSLDEQNPGRARRRVGRRVGPGQQVSDLSVLMDPVQGRSLGWWRLRSVHRAALPLIAGDMPVPKIGGRPSPPKTPIFYRLATGAGRNRVLAKPEAKNGLHGFSQQGLRNAPAGEHGPADPAGAWFSRTPHPQN
ncbi:hypothetical protein GCM10009527_083260 [Actinomadura nitritigenes]